MNGKNALHSTYVDNNCESHRHRFSRVLAAPSPSSPEMHTHMTYFVLQVISGAKRIPTLIVSNLVNLLSDFIQLLDLQQTSGKYLWTTLYPIKLLLWTKNKVFHKVLVINRSHQSTHIKPSADLRHCARGYTSRQDLRRWSH